MGKPDLNFIAKTWWNGPGGDITAINACRYAYGCTLLIDDETYITLTHMLGLSLNYISIEGYCG